MEKINTSFYKNKTVFVTGHTGFKGSWLSYILLMSGAHVVGYGLEPDNSTTNLFELLHLSEHMKSNIADIRNITALENAVQSSHADMVFHLAAQPLVSEAYENPVYTYETNVMGTVHLLEACRRLDGLQSILNVTTDKVYENKEWQWGYRENDNLCGHDPYSNSKSCSELVTSCYKNSFYQSKVPLSTARSGNVIGGGDFSKNRIIPDCIRAACDKNPILLRNPQSTRPYQHVLDTLFGYLLLAEKQFVQPSLSGSYNFGPNESDFLSTENLVNLFCEVWADGLTWESHKTYSFHEANFLKLDCSSAKHNLNWQPKWDIRKAVEYTVQWTKEWQSGADVRKITEQQIRSFEQDGNA